MKHIRKDGSVVDGTPEEIAQYHKLMTRGSQRRRNPKRTGKGLYTAAEDAQLRKMIAAGKTYKQIASKLWSLKLSPYRRTEKAVEVRAYVLSK